MAALDPIKGEVVLSGNDEFLMAIDEWIRSGTVTLDVQPVVSLKAGVPDHLEALARIKRSPPSGFIVRLEEHRLINVLDRYIIQLTCEYLSRHPNAPQIFVNVSGLSISENGRFTTYIQRQLIHFGVAPGQLGLEITERVMVADDANTASFIRHMKALGIAIAFDDFGVGQLRLENLRQIKPEIVKIDGSFVRNMDDSRSDRMIVQSLTNIAHSFGALVVAEHVENEAILNIIRDMGIDFAQGWHTGKPQPLDG